MTSYIAMDLIPIMQADTFARLSHLDLFLLIIAALLILLGWIRLIFFTLYLFSVDFFQFYVFD